MRLAAVALLLCACGGRIADDDALPADAAPHVDASKDGATSDVLDASDASVVLDATTTTATSCADVLANGNSQSGEYSIIEDNQVITVYCDMTIAGGGFTAFFSSVVGDAFAHFEAAADVCPKPDTQCLRHVPSDVDTSRLFAVSCGADAVVFHLNSSTLDYFATGAQHRWQALADVAAGAGNPNLAYATKLWTGDGANQGWIVSSDDNEPSFTPHTFASAYDFNATWSFCNGTPSTTATVRILYR